MEAAIKEKQDAEMSDDEMVILYLSFGNENENSLGNNPKNVNITAGELGRIEKALKQDEFRKLLVEYANEVQDPKSKENYEADIIKLEAERGIKCTFLRPQPGHVVKARHLDDNNEKPMGKNEKVGASKVGGKAFINIWRRFWQFYYLYGTE